MSKEIKRIILEGKIKEDNRLYINFKFFQDDRILDDLEIVALLVASLSMSVKSAIANMDYETQGRLLKDVLGKLENDFFNIDSFKDLEKHIKPKRR
jgi:hypothetical protein